jgi:hypothetical protein
MLEAVLAAFDPVFGEGAPLNPTSSVYGGRMIDPAALHLWTWDARPYPIFPAAVEVWSDGPNWDTGHWLTGRFGSAPLDALVAAILTDAGCTDFDTEGLGEGPEGYVIDRPMSPRAAIEALASAYAFDAAELAGVLVFRQRGGAPVAELGEDDLVLAGEAAPFRLTRMQETELPNEVTLGFTDVGTDFRRAVASSRRLVGGSARVSHAELAIVTHDAASARRAEIWLQDLWASRESATFALPASRLPITPGDVIGLTLNGRRRLLEVREAVDTEQRSITARSIDPEVFSLPLSSPRRRAAAMPAAIGPVHVLLLDLPLLKGEEPPVLTRAAVYAKPWPGAVSIWRSADGLSFERAGVALAPAIVGETLDPLPRGPVSRWDRFSRVRVRLHGGALASVSDTVLLNGANAAAVRRADGAWEILQFANAVLVDPQTYELSRLVRGREGSEWAMGDPTPAGASFVLLDDHLVPVARGLNALGRTVTLRIVAASRDHGDAAAVEIAATPQATALRPLSPGHLRARRTAEGLVLSWIRRTRLDAHNPLLQEVPLGEEREAYSVEVLSGGEVVRSFETATPRLLYPAADEIADFGAPQASLAVRIAQLSAAVGRGIPTESILVP